MLFVNVQFVIDMLVSFTYKIASLASLLSNWQFVSETEKVSSNLNPLCTFLSLTLVLMISIV